jgi:hypothetical protein
MKIIEFDARGECIKVCESILSLSDSSYFKNILNDLNESNKIFIDCDGDVLRHILAYIETGYISTYRYNPKYMKKMFEKFDVPINGKIKVKQEVKQDIKQDIKQEIKQDIKQDIKQEVKHRIRIREKHDEIEINVVNEIKKFIKKYDSYQFNINVKVLHQNNPEFHSQNNELIFLLPFIKFREMKNVSKSEILINNFKKQLSTSNYKVTDINFTYYIGNIDIYITFTREIEEGY